MWISQTKINMCNNLITIKLFENLWVFVFWWTKKIFWRMLLTKQLTVAIDFHSMGKNMKVNGYHQMYNNKITILHIFFCAQQKKLIKVWNSLRLSKWNIFNFSIFTFKITFTFFSRWYARNVYIFTSQHVFIFCPYFFIFMHLFPSLYVALLLALL